MVSPVEGLLTCSVIDAAVGVVIIAGVVELVVVGAAGLVVGGLTGVVVVIGVVVVAPVLPGVQVSVAVTPTSPALTGSSLMATGTEMTISAPLTFECAYANRLCPPVKLGMLTIVSKLVGPEGPGAMPGTVLPTLMPP